MAVLIPSNAKEVLENNYNIFKGNSTSHLED